MLAAVAIGSLPVLACSRFGPRAVEPTPTPKSGGVDPTQTSESLEGLICEGDHLYPDADGSIPIEGSYLIEPPVRGEVCAIQLTQSEKMIAYLEIKTSGVYLWVIVPDIEAPLSAFGSIPPSEGKPAEGEFRGLKFRVTLLSDGNYLIEYTYDDSAYIP